MQPPRTLLTKQRKTENSVLARTHHNRHTLTRNSFDTRLIAGIAKYNDKHASPRNLIFKVFLTDEPNVDRPRHANHVAICDQKTTADIYQCVYSSHDIRSI
jgi:hypothetical protein